MALGIIDEPLRILLRTEFAVYVGIVYTYLPFMILPLYANLSRSSTPSLLEAAARTSAAEAASTTFLTGDPAALRYPGIIAGSMLVFIPATGEFVIPEHCSAVPYTCR